MRRIALGRGTLGWWLSFVVVVAGCGGGGVPSPDAHADVPGDTPARGDSSDSSESGKDAGPGQNADSGPGLGSDTGPGQSDDAGEDTGPDQNIDSGPGQAGDTGPDQGGDAIRDAGPDQGGDAIREAGPDQGGDAIRDAGPDQKGEAGQDAKAGDAPSDVSSSNGSDAADVRPPTDAAQPFPAAPCTPPSVNPSGVPYDNGRVCATDSQCASGHCVDGICCTSACTGPCQSCWGDQVGLCARVTSTVDPDTCAGDRACSAQGACLARDGQSCSAATDCAFGYCVAGKCCGTATCQPVHEWQLEVAAAYTVAASNDGSIYASGAVSSNSPVDVDPRHVCVASASNQTFYILKVDGDGRTLWVRILSATDSAGFVDSKRMVVTADGGLAITGYFEGMVDFDPGPRAEVHAANGQSIFVTRYATDGTYEWTQTWDGSAIVTYPDIAPKADGGVLVAGSYKTTIDFDPSPGTDMHTAAGGGTNSEGYLLSLAADGRYLGVTTWPSTASSTLGSVATGGPNDDIVVCGGVSGDTDLDPGPGVQMVSSSPGGFVLSLDKKGAFRWKHLFNHAGAANLGVTSSGDVLLQGGFSGTADFDPSGSHVMYTAKNSFDLFVTKLSGTDGSHVWTRPIYSGSPPNAPRMKVGPAGSAIVLAQTKLSSVDLDPGPGTATATFTGPYMNWYVLQLSATGDYLFSEVPAFLPYDLASSSTAPIVLGAVGLTVTPWYIVKYAP